MYRWRDADSAEMVRLTDARQHEQLRRVEHAAGEQHLACDRRLMEAAVSGVLDARRARALEDHPGRQRVRLDREVGPPHGWPQKGHGGAAAPAIPDGPLTATKALLLLAVVVLGERPVGLLRRIEPGVEQGISIAGIDDAQRPAAAAPGVLALLPAFAMLEVGEDFGIRPATAAVPGPPVVVAAVTAH